MFGYYYYITAEEAAREHINDLIKDAENEHRLHEFLKSHPECTTAAKMWAFINKILGRRAKVDFKQKPSHVL